MIKKENKNFRKMFIVTEYAAFKAGAIHVFFLRAVFMKVHIS